MSSQELAWRTPGVCPSCGVVANQSWFTDLRSTMWDDNLDRNVTHKMRGHQGWPRVSRCQSQSCGALAFWIKNSDHEHLDGETEMVYPQTGIRIPPPDGLEPEEVELYEEAAAVSPTSRRAASALLRVLLEAFLKRHLAAASPSVKGKNLAELIDVAVADLDLSQTLKDGLTAIRKRGNASVHDPYGLTDEARSADLPWLFQAVDDLVDDLHVKPDKWAGMI